MPRNAHKYSQFSPAQQNITKYIAVSLVVLLPCVSFLNQKWHLPLQALGQSVAFYLSAAFIVIFILPTNKTPCQFGVANCITLLRLIIVAIFTSNIGFLHLIPDVGMWWLMALGVSGIALDGVDGWLARSLGLESEFGAKFDMEVDAAFILILSLITYELPHIGPWVILAGLLRYIFLVSGWAFPALRRPLPSSFRRKFICILQMSAMVFVLCPLTTATIDRLSVATAVFLLLLSFLYDTLHLLNPVRRQNN